MPYLDSVENDICDVSLYRLTFKCPEQFVLCGSCDHAYCSSVKPFRDADLVLQSCQ